MPSVRLEVEVESVVEAVELELAGREEPVRGLGGEGGRELRLGRGRRLAVETGEVAGKVAGQERGLLVGRVVGVDERAGAGRGLI